MAALLNKIFKKKSFQPEKEQRPTFIPPPKLVETDRLYDYIDFSPAIQDVHKQYVYSMLKFKEMKEKLKKLEDNQFHAVLQGRVTADDSFNFTSRYDDLRERVHKLDVQRKSLRRKVKSVKKPSFPLKRQTVYYDPI